MAGDSNIFLGKLPEAYWVRIQGKANFENSPALKTCLQQVCDEGAETIIIDLEQCMSMDSTFMGTLTGVALQMYGKGKLEVINANERNVALLESLGLDQILELDAKGERWREESANISKLWQAWESKEAEHIGDMEEKEKTEFILKAHEALGEANPDNVIRFENVVHYLKKDLEEE